MHTDHVCHSVFHGRSFYTWDLAWRVVRTWFKKKSKTKKKHPLYTKCYWHCAVFMPHIPSEAYLQSVCNIRWIRYSMLVIPHSLFSQLPGESEWMLKCRTESLLLNFFSFTLPVSSLAIRFWPFFPVRWCKVRERDWEAALRWWQVWLVHSAAGTDWIWQICSDTAGAHGHQGWTTNTLSLSPLLISSVPLCLSLRVRVITHQIRHAIGMQKWNQLNIHVCRPNLMQIF